MRLLGAALGGRLTDEQWREMEATFGGGEGPTRQVEGRRRRWGEYKKSRDQFIR